MRMTQCCQGTSYVTVAQPSSGRHQSCSSDKARSELGFWDSKLDKQLVDLWGLKGSLCCKPPAAQAHRDRPRWCCGALSQSQIRARSSNVPFGQKTRRFVQRASTLLGGKASVDKNAILTFLCPCPAFATGALSIRQRSLQTDVASWEHTILQRLSPLPSNMPPREQISFLKDPCLVFEKVGAYHLL